MKEKFRLIISSFKRRGIFNTLIFVISDLIFDIIYKTDTVKFEDLDTLQIDSENRKYGVRYQPSNYFLLKLFFNKFADSIKNSTLLDFGSGKGRVLMMAATYGARKTIGVEFSKELVDISYKNIEIFKLKRKIDTHFEIFNVDATTFEALQDVNIFFFYNPFDENVMSKVLSNIRIKSTLQNNNIILVYINPVHKKLFYENNFVDIWNYNDEIIVFK